MKFKVNGQEVFASTGGRPFDKNKPLIIFVHGSGLTHMTWVLQTRYFAFHGYSVLALDLPGHGLSSGKSLKSIEEDLLANKLTYPFIWKSAQFGYDGKGVKVVENNDQLKKLPNLECIVEEKIKIQKELSIIVSRNESNEESNFPIVEMEFNQQSNLVEQVICPANIPQSIRETAFKIATKLSRSLNNIGLLAIEMFLTQDNKILINEIAPRPHNSGHHTIECCHTSQFEQHLRSILNLPLGDTSIKIPCNFI